MTSRSHTVLQYVLVASFACAAATTTLAAVKTEQKTTMKFEGGLGRVMGLFGGDAAKDGLVTTTVVAGDRMYTSSDDRRAQIIDLAEGRMYDLDLRDKKYEVTTFDELRERIEEMRERARKQAPPDAPSRQADGDGQPQREVEVDLDVQRPGDTREFSGRQAELVVTTVTVREKGRTLEDAGGIVMTARSWNTDDVTGMQEILDFQRRYAEALGEIFGFESSAEQMTSAMAMFPGLGEAMKRFQEEGVQAEGTAMLTEMTFENVKPKAEVAAAPAPAPEPEQPRRGRFGGLGGLGDRLGRSIGGGGDADADAGKPRSTIFETTSELLNIDTNPDTTLTVIPADFEED